MDYKKLLFPIFILFITTFSFAGTIKGKVFDSQTGEPLSGATVVLKNTTYATVVNLDGSFVFKNIPAGNYNVFVKNIGYKTSAEKTVDIKDNNAIEQVTFTLQTEAVELTGVSVTGYNKESDRAVRGLEKNSSVIENILSARTIQLLPDVTVANALQRISGVTIQRSKSGEGRYAIIRGMNQRYNNTLVNGIKIPSPDDKYRFVPMDIFPSEMLERLEVVKALRPDMEGDAIGGTMNLVMKTAPTNFIFNANIAGGYSALFSDRPFSKFSHLGIQKNSPAEIHGNDYTAAYTDFTKSNLNYTSKTHPLNNTIGATIGDRFLQNKLGVLISASYQNFYRGSNSDYLIPNAQPNPNPANQPVFSDVYKRQFSTQTNRIGIHNNIDFIINKRNKISLYNLYVHQNEFETRHTADTVLGINSTSTLKLVDIENRSRWQKQSVYNSTLQGDHLLGDAFHLNWSAVYSVAKEALPDMATFTVENDVHLDGNGKQTSVDKITKSMDRIWQHNADKDIAGYLNLAYNIKLLQRDAVFSIGGLYRHKKRDNYYNEYSLVPTPIGTQQNFTDINSASYGFTIPSKGTGNITALTPNNYTTKEDVGAGYIEGKIMLLRQLEILGGVRIENTDQQYTTVMPETFDARYGSIKYTDVLPSVHFKYALNDKQNVRLSYFKSISRPGFGEIVPYLYPGDYFDEIGNPYLKHTTADNLDLRYELFPGGADQVLVGVFYKHLTNPIEYFVVRNGGPSAQFIKPDNVDEATNYGIEAQVTKYIGKFGISANYTYTHSKVTTNKLNYHYDPAQGNVQNNISQTRPLQGQADNVGNLSLLYKNPKIGLDLQVAYVYTGERITQVSPYYGLDFWQHPYSQLDFSAELALGKRFSLYTKINNLTNTPNKVYLKYPSSKIPNALPNQDDPNKILVQKDIYKISFLGGVRFKL